MDYQKHIESIAGHLRPEQFSELMLYLADGRTAYYDGTSYWTMSNGIVVVDPTIKPADIRNVVWKNVNETFQQFVDRSKDIDALMKESGTVKQEAEQRLKESKVEADKLK